MMILSPFAAHASTLVFRAEFDSTLEQVSQIGTAHNADFTFHDSHVNLVAVFGAGRFTDGLDIGQTRRGSLSIYEAASGALSVECLLAGAGGGDYCRDYHASSGSVLAAYAVSDLGLSLHYADFFAPFEVRAFVDGLGGTIRTLTGSPFRAQVGDISFFETTDFELQHNFSLSNVNLTPLAPVPLPAGAALLFSAGALLGGLGRVRSRRLRA